MEADDIRRKGSDFTIGGPLDMLSVDELAQTISLLEEEIGRIRSAMEKKRGTMAAAELLFRK